MIVMMMFVENGDGDDNDEQGKDLDISMLELDNFEIIETREAEIEY